MKIGIVGYPTLGGSGMVATSLALELANRGFEVHFFSYKTPFPIEFSSLHSNFNFHRVSLETYPLFRETGPNYGLQLASCLIKMVNSIPLDLINTHYAIPHAVSAYLTKLATQVPIVNTLHGSDVHTLGQAGNFRNILSLVLNNSRTTAVSTYLSNIAKDIFNMDEPPKVIYNFVDTDKFIPSPQKEDLRIVAAGNFRPVKNFPFLVECFAAVSKEFDDWKLWMIGDGPQRPDCFKIAMKFGITDQVRFIPPSKEIPLEFAKASLLAAPSIVESFGLTIAEGMSSGLPIWASKVGGIPEVCVDGENGLLFDPSNKQESIEKLRILLDDEKLRKKMGLASRNRILQKFHPRKIVNEYIKEFERTVELI